jgi:dTDP-4-amino-4,6-dideoxygalactose transaminase
MLSDGPNVRELEILVKERYNVDYVIACSSCTIGLLISIQALDKLFNIPKLISTPSFGWYSSKWAIETSGHECEWIDIDPHTWLYDHNSYIDIVAMPIHTFGSVDVNDSRFVIYDGAHALGSKIKDFGNATVMSLAPTKLITSCEGGLILTNDQQIAEEIIQLRHHVSRMSELNAIWGIETLEHIDEVLEWKKKVYEYYKKNLPGTFQYIPNHSNYNTIGFLTDLYMPPEIEYKKYYLPLRFGLPNTNNVYGKMVCLPSWYGVDYEYVVERIKEFNRL